jgi:ketosteroid isomerase-like protein
MTRTMQNVFVCTLTIICIICVLSSSYSHAEEYKDYTVKKGDTLWGISSSEMSNPFSWPKVWKENPEIKNPDLIYPGQTIKIPIKTIKEEVAPPPQPKPVAEEPPKPAAEAMPQSKAIKAKPLEKAAVPIAPIEKKYLVDRNTFISSGFISDTVEHMGKIVGAPSGRSSFGEGDYVYVSTDKPVNINDRFLVIRSLGSVKHPFTGAELGCLVKVLGIAEIVGEESGETKAKIVSSFDGIIKGDLLNYFSEPDVPYLTGKPRTPYINGVIVAVKNRHTLNGMLNFVYVDKGKEDGLEAGDVLEIHSKNQYTIPNGSIQIIKMKEKTSTAIVRTSNEEVSVGDLVVPAGNVKSAARVMTTPSGETTVEEEVNLFLSKYADAYESADIDRFMGFYSKSAVENNTLHYDEIRHAYEENFRNRRYSYSLTNIDMQKSDDHIRVTGTYTIRTLKGDSSGTVTTGNIRWTLKRENGALEIVRVDYNRQ